MSHPEENDPVFRSSYDVERAKKAFSTLVDLYWQTDPSLGKASANSKDWRAQESLSAIGVIMASLCDWAMRERWGNYLKHVSGTQMDGYKIPHSSEILAHTSSEDLPIRYYREFIADVFDSMRGGLGIAGKGRTVHPAAQLSVRGTILNQFSYDLLTALEALNQGEIQPIFIPIKKKGKHGAQYTLAPLKRAAVWWKYVLFGQKLADGIDSIKLAEGRVRLSIRLRTTAGIMLPVSSPPPWNDSEKPNLIRGIIF